MGVQLDSSHLSIRASARMHCVSVGVEVASSHHASQLMAAVITVDVWYGEVWGVPVRMVDI